MEGHLYKYKNLLSGWKKRYFVLKDNILYYHKNKGEEVKGRIHLSVATIKESSKKKEKEFEIHSGITVFFLRAETKQEKDTWVTKLKSVKFETENQDNHILQKDIKIYEDKTQEVQEEITSLQSKILELRLQTRKLQNYNEKISELHKDKNFNDVKLICDANRVNKILFT